VTLRVEHVMGMPVRADIRSPVAPAVLDGVFAWFRDVDARFSPFKRESAVARRGRGERARDAELDAVLAECEALRRRTDGYFDAYATGTLDPSGLVKGWAVAGAAERLADAGLANFCINAGGDVIARGRPAPDRLWRVGIRHPVDLDRLAAVLAVEDMAVATSGEYERGAHIVDPHTGAPPTGLLSVTVVGPDLAAADAYATAAFAMGAGGPAWTTTLAGYDAMCITSEHRVLSTPGFARHRA
jgi:thiamine biosynthesis lipoprotein